MFGWAALVTVWAVPTVPTMFAEFIFEIADPFEIIVSPWTVRLVRVPTDVMFGCAAFVTDCATGTDPTMFAEFIFEIADPFEIIASPWTFRLLRVPRDVMFGCEFWVTTRAVMALGRLPTMFEAFKLDRP